jgi:signal transduction histidine kinase
MTRRLLASYLGLALLMLLALEIPLAALAKRYEVDLSAGQAAREAAGLAGLVSEDLEHREPSGLPSLVSAYHSSTGGEVAVIAPSGTVLAYSSSDRDSDVASDWPDLIQRGMEGTPASTFSNDEGQPWAAAVAPISVDNRPRGVVLLAVPASATLQRVHDIWLALGALAAAMLALTAGVGFVLARSLSRPLTRLTEAVSSLGRGDLSSRAAVDSGPPQVRELGREFNHMAARLAEVVDAQSRFVAEASHQLRSPLTALRLRLENLEAEAGDPASEGIAAAGRELQRLSRIVDGLLTLSRAGNDEPERSPVDVVAVIDERCDAWATLADERGVTLIAQQPDDAGLVAQLVAGDFEQILDNLLANALDASRPGSRITVTREPTVARQARVHVVDEGPGMTEQQRAHAFDRFWTGASSDRGHSGLGLAIVRQLAIRNDLTVELQPAEPAGLDVVLSLPTMVAPAARHLDQRGDSPGRGGLAR